MKWSVQQLNKFLGNSFDFNFECDFSSKIEGLSDVISINKTKVSGKCSVPQWDVFEFDLLIEATLVLECARTLEHVDFPVLIETKEIFSYDIENDEHLIIEKNTIDLFDIVWEIVLLNKPIRVLKYPDNDDDF